MNNKDLEKEIQQELSDVNQERLETYMRMFDRILLYTIAANMVPAEVIQQTIHIWATTIKKIIDSDATGRTQFLEATVQGRLAKLHKEADGEELRLNCLKAWNVAHKIVTANLVGFDEEEIDTGE